MNLRSVIGSQSGPLAQRVGRKLKKKADHFRVVGGRFNLQGNLLRRLVMGGQRKNGLLHLPTRILKVYIETLPGFGHKYHPDGLNSMFLSSLCP